ncbi:hypothetical protein BEN47_17775 [Hymenobacter lapidarius]|uniref:Uncharacterized protein n=1 Tax=Hymenobacter lapidarius TaxID=1908237 RepID=A0A1G1SX35_9BACT|nr:hypothetical protein BEN47_17775 [Hymenobacter lapidarius]
MGSQEELTTIRMVVIFNQKLSSEPEHLFAVIILFMLAAPSEKISLQGIALLFGKIAILVAIARPEH